MDKKIINWKEEFIKMFPETTERVLKSNYKWCEKCSGVGFTRHGVYISFCNACLGRGQIGLCSEECGNDRKYPLTICKECDSKKEYYRKKLVLKKQQK